MASKSYYIAAHVQKMLDNLRKSKETCDIRLLASNKEISAHKVVLASGSEYFKNAIYGLLLNDSGKTELELKDVKYEILCELVNFMYTGKVVINSENVFDIYNAADYYLINLLKNACLDFMEEILDAKNCIKIWIIANNSQHKKLLTAADNFIFSNMKIASNEKDFLNLSNEEILDFFKRWPKHEVFDSIITSVLKWAANKENWEETILQILKDISDTNISNDYFTNFLTTNQLIENSNSCTKWMLNIAKEKLKSEEKKQLKSEAEVKFARFLSDQPIIFMTGEGPDGYKFQKYNCRDGAFQHYNNKNINHTVYSINPYKNWIYVVGKKSCSRFIYDDLNENGYESAFHHKHEFNLRSVILNDSMYIFGGESNSNKGSIIHLNTKQTTNINLLYNRINSGVAVSDGSIYICGGKESDIIERFDSREGLSIKFGTMHLRYTQYGNAATLSNQLYVCNGEEYKVMDLRNNKICVEIQEPASILDREYVNILFSSYRKLYTVRGRYIYEYINATTKWLDLGICSDVHLVNKINLSFE